MFARIYINRYSNIERFTNIFLWVKSIYIELVVQWIFQVFNIIKKSSFIGNNTEIVLQLPANEIKLSCENFLLKMCSQLKWLEVAIIRDSRNRFPAVANPVSINRGEWALSFKLWWKNADRDY